MKLVCAISTVMLLVAGFSAQAQSTHDHTMHDQFEDGHVTYEKVITPSQTFSIWMSINKVLVNYAKLQDLGEETISQIEGVGINVFTDKKPEDVFALVGEFSHVFVKYTGTETTSHGDNLSNLEETIVGTLMIGESEVLPSMVFARSLVVLDILMQSYVRQGVNGELLSPYFLVNDYENKVPSDVYALVDKAHKRLQVMINASGGE